METRPMTMHHPPHPGEFITEVYLKPNELSARRLARHLDVASATLSRILNGASRVAPEMALRLSKVIGRSPQSWLAMQDEHDLWQAGKHIDLGSLTELSALAVDAA